MVQRSQFGEVWRIYEDGMKSNTWVPERQQHSEKKLHHCTSSIFHQKDLSRAKKIDLAINLLSLVLVV